MSGPNRVRKMRSLSAVAVELFGIGIPPCHHGGTLRRCARTGSLILTLGLHRIQIRFSLLQILNCFAEDGREGSPCYSQGNTGWSKSRLIPRGRHANRVGDRCRCGSMRSVPPCKRAHIGRMGPNADKGRPQRGRLRTPAGYEARNRKRCSRNSGECLFLWSCAI